MSELEDIKARAEKIVSRFPLLVAEQKNTIVSDLHHLKDYFDRAIAIAEVAKSIAFQSLEQYNTVVHERDEARNDLLELQKRHEELVSELSDEVVEARAAVLKLRDELCWWIDEHPCCAGHERNLLADTDSYERYR